jgi:hypothetical protein
MDLLLGVGPSEQGDGTPSDCFGADFQKSLFCQSEFGGARLKGALIFGKR